MKRTRLIHMNLIILTGALADGTAVTGKIVIPEVAHDSTEDDYVVWIKRMG